MKENIWNVSKDNIIAYLDRASVLLTTFVEQGASTKCKYESEQWEGVEDPSYHIRTESSLARCLIWGYHTCNPT